MNTIILEPNDVLFFKDTRPMEGSLAGHGAGWPMPDVISAAFHAALHREGFNDVHMHRFGKSGKYLDDVRNRKFGSLQTAGPYPVYVKNHTYTWYFPKPLDMSKNSPEPTLLPTDLVNSKKSSLPAPLRYPVANALPPSKEGESCKWISKNAFEMYLKGKMESLNGNDFKKDDDIFIEESTIGVAIDPETCTSDSGKVYSAHYLRLKENWKIGVFACAKDKDFKSERYGNDLIKALLNDKGKSIIVGGQQRTCLAKIISEDGKPLPLPLGMTDGFKEINGKYHVKWILISPAIWQQIPEDKTEEIKAHPGGWLPNWIDPDDGSVLLKAGDTERLPGESREEWRKRVREMPGISARLVAAVVPKPIVVSGWALEVEEIKQKGGAQSSHLAVPAGAIYYFEARTKEDAVNLASALNWHGQKEGNDIPTIVRNRRSGLLGEKGFGIGVCGTWEFFKKSAKSAD